MNKFLFLILLAAAAFGGTTSVSSLPVTCNTNGEYYSIADDLSATATAITISADTVHILGGGHSITFGTESVGTGILLGQHIDKLTIDSLTVIQGEYGEHSFSNSAARNFDSLIITNCNWYAHYNGTECVYAENLSGTNAVIFAGCSLNVGPAAREESHGFLMSGTGTLNGRIHHNKIHLQDSCWAGRSACCGVLVKGRVQIDSNILYEDQTFQGEGIALYGSGKQHIFGNKLYMTSHNSRGILVDGNTDSCNIHNNILYMDIEDAPPGGGESQSYGIRVRFGSDSNWIHHNTIEGTGGLANGIAIGGMEVTPRLAPKRNTIEYNNITSIYRCILIYDGTLDTTQFNNNSYTTSGSNSPVYCWVHVSELKGIEFEADTFAYASDYAVTVNTYYGHASEPIIFRNCITIDSTDITGGTNFVDYIVIEGEEPPPPPPEYFHNTANFTILDTAYSASGDTVSCIVHANTWKHDLYLQAAIDTSGEIVNVDSAVGLVPGINDTLTCNFGTRFLRIFGKTTK